MAINTSITTLPTPPTSTDSATFSTRADAFLAALPTFQTQLNSYAGEANSTQTAINATQSAAAASASSAQAAQSAAAASASSAQAASDVAAGAANYRGIYSAATTYTLGQSVSFSGAVYIANKTNLNITPVSGADWFLIPNGDVTLNDTQTLTKKTLSAPVLVSPRNNTASFSPASGGTVTLDLSTANVFVITLPSSGTVTIAAPTNPPASGTYFEFALKFVTQGTAAVTFNGAFKFPGAVAPGLTAVTGKVDTLVAYTTDGGASYQTFTAGLNA